MNARELAQEFAALMMQSHKHHSTKKVNDEMRGEPMIMQCILMHEGDITPGEISKNLGTTTARIAAALNSLEKKGLIIREIDKKDRRRILIKMTPEGLAYSEERKKEMFEKLTAMMEYLGEEDGAEFIRILNRLKDWHSSCHEQE